jgi:hypothetical protein
MSAQPAQESYLLFDFRRNVSPFWGMRLGGGAILVFIGDKYYAVRRSEIGPTNQL